MFQTGAPGRGQESGRSRGLISINSCSERVSTAALDIDCDSIEVAKLALKERKQLILKYNVPGRSTVLARQHPGHLEKTATDAS
jgi:hypothetical protein